MSPKISKFGNTSMMKTLGYIIYQYHRRKAKNSKIVIFSVFQNIRILGNFEGDLWKPTNENGNISNLFTATSLKMATLLPFSLKWGDLQRTKKVRVLRFGEVLLGYIWLPLNLISYPQLLSKKFPERNFFWILPLSNSSSNFERGHSSSKPVCG